MQLVFLKQEVVYLSLGMSVHVPVLLLNSVYVWLSLKCLPVKADGTPSA